MSFISREGDDDEEKERLASQLDETLRQCEFQIDQLAQKDEVIEQLRFRNAALEKEVFQVNSETSKRLKDRLQLMEKELEDTSERLEEALDRIKEKEELQRRLDMTNKELQVRNLKLDTDLQNERQRGEDMESELRALRQSSKRKIDEETLNQETERKRRQSMIEALTENEGLRSKNASLSQTIESLHETIGTRESLCNDKDEQIRSMESKIQQLDFNLREQRQLLEAKEKEFADIHEELLVVTEFEDEVKKTLNEKNLELKTAVNDLKEQLQVERGKNAKLEEQQMKISDTRKASMDEALLEVEGIDELSRMDLLETQRRLSKSRDDMDRIKDAYNALKSEQKRLIDSAVEEKVAEINKLRIALQSKSDEILEMRALQQDILNQKEEVEMQLHEAQESCIEYEKGHGLKESVLKLKALKGDIRRRDKEIQRLNMKLGDLIISNDRLHEIVRRLKVMADIAEDFRFDEAELDEAVQIQYEKQGALVRELTSQNDGLEKERLRLLEALRRNAVNFSEKSMKYSGLSGEQVSLVNDFVENLKTGTVDLPLNDKSYQLSQKVTRMESEIAELTQKLAMAEVALENRVRDSDESEKPNRENPVFAQPDLAMTSQSMTEELSKHMQRIEREQMKMVSDIKQLIENHYQDTTDQRRSEQLTKDFSHLIDSLKSTITNKKSLKNLEDAGARTGNSEFDSVTVSSKSDSDNSDSRQNKIGAKKLSINKSSKANTGSNEQQVELDAEYTSKQVDPGSVDRSPNKIQLPPDEWAKRYTYMQKQLSFCLELLLSKEKDIKRLENVLTNTSGLADIFSTQVGLLYAEYFDKLDALRRSNSQLNTQLEDAKGERDAFRKKARRLDTLCATLEEENEENIRDQLKKMTREIAFLEVNEVVLSRKHDLLTAEEFELRRQNEAIQVQLIDTETSLRERLVYLEEWKSGALSTIKSLLSKIEACVPREIFEQTLRKLTHMNILHYDVQEREAILRTRCIETTQLRNRVSELEAELKLVRLDVDENRKRERITHEDIHPATEMSKVKADLIEKDILLTSSTVRSEILSKRIKDLVSELEELRAEMKQADSLLENSRKQISDQQEEIMLVHEKFIGGATRSERMAMEDRIEDLGGKIESLSRENCRLRELIDIANAQAQARGKISEANHEEIEKLREELRNANAASERDALVGKLQHELSSSKANQQRALKRYADAASQIRRLEEDRLRLETFIDERDRKLHAVVEESRIRVLALETALSEVGVFTPVTEPCDQQRQIDGYVDSRRSRRFDSISIRMFEAIVRLGESAEKAEESLRSSENVRRVLESKLEEQRIDLDSTKALLEGLQKRWLISNDRIHAQANDSDGKALDPKKLTNRVFELSESLTSANIEGMRQKRDIQLLRDEKEWLESLKEKNEAYMSELESCLAKNIESQTQQPVNWGISKPLRTLSEKLQKSQTKAQFSEDRLKSEESERGISHDMPCDADYSRNFKSENRENHQDRLNEGKTLSSNDLDIWKIRSAALKTIESLKTTIMRKNSTIEKLRAKLDPSQKPPQKISKDIDITIDGNSERLFVQNQIAINNLRAAQEEIFGNGIIDKFDRSLSNDISAELPLNDVKTEMFEMKASARHKNRKIRRLKLTIEELESKLQRDGLKKQCEQNDALKTLEEERLKHEHIRSKLSQKLNEKSEKLKQYRKVIASLKDEFVKSEEIHEEEMIQKDEEISAIRASTNRVFLAMNERKIQEMKENSTDIETVNRGEDSREELKVKQQRIEALSNGNLHLYQSLEEHIIVESQLKRELDNAKERIEKMKLEIEEKTRINLELQSNLRSSGLSPCLVNTQTQCDSDINLSGVDSSSMKSEKETKKISLLKKELRVQRAKVAEMQAQLVLEHKKNEEEYTLNINESLTVERQKVNLLRETQVEQRCEINHLNQEINTMREQSRGLEEKLKYFQDKASPKNAKPSEDHSSDSELEDFLTRNELEEKIAKLSSEIIKLEGSILTRENTILELRFELEQAKSNLENSELVELRGISSISTVRVGASSGPLTSKKRERELENVIESLKKVIINLKTKNMQLQDFEKNENQSKALSRKLSESRKKMEELQKHKKDLEERLDKTTRSSSEQIEKYKEELGNLKKKLDAKNSGVKQAEKQLECFRRHEDEESKEHSNEIQELNKQLNNEKELSRMLQTQLRCGSDTMHDDIFKLREENQRLLDELNAFDADFFEEIEELKYKHHKALEEIKHLRQLGADHSAEP